MPQIFPGYEVDFQLFPPHCRLVSSSHHSEYVRRWSCGLISSRMSMSLWSHMKRFILRWVTLGVGLFVLFVLLLQVSEPVAKSVIEPLMNPWLAICQTVTPEAWQTDGNILLGLGWLVSGALVYSMLLSAVILAIRGLIVKAKSDTNGNPAQAPE